jgi:hypothetical protein
VPRSWTLAHQLAPGPGPGRRQPLTVTGFRPPASRCLGPSDTFVVCQFADGPGLKSLRQGGGSTAGKAQRGNGRVRQSQQPVHLRLAVRRQMDIRLLDHPDLSDSALSKQLTTLEDAGYIEIRKGLSESGHARRRGLPASAGRPSTSTSRPCRRSSPRRARRCSPRPERRKEGSLLTATFARGAGSATMR